MFKQHRKKLLKLSSGIILYEWLLTGVYPVIAENPAVTEIAEAFPSAVKTVFGVSAQARVDTFEAFISAQFFARIWTPLMAIYGINMANALLAELVDNGSLVFPLSTPVSRADILITQAAVLVSSNSILIAATLAGLSSGAFVFGIELNHRQYLRLGVLGFAFLSVIGGYSLLFSAWFAEEERALAYAYGLTFAFYALDVIGGLTDKLSWARHLSLFHLFKPQEVLEGTKNPFGAIIGLTSGAAILLALATKVFEGKDLAL